MSEQWNTWNQWNHGRGKNKGANPKGAGKQKKEESKESKPAFPAYDGAFSASSSSAPPSNVVLSDQVIGLLQQLATKDKDMAEAISAVITPEPTDQELLKVQQRKLNHMRKLQTKIYKKEKNIKDKEASMSKFLVDVRKHIESEKLRHKQETDLLAKELQELKDQLQKAKEGKDDGVEEQMEDLDELLDEPDQEKVQLRDRLAQAEHANYAMQQQLKLFQGQMTEFMHNYKRETGQPVGTPPGLAFSPQQEVKAPVISLDEALAAADPTGKKRDAKQPFCLSRRGRMEQGPYSQETKKDGPEEQLDDVDR